MTWVLGHTCIQSKTNLMCHEFLVGPLIPSKYTDPRALLSIEGLLGTLPLQDYLRGWCGGTATFHNLSNVAFVI